MMEELYKVMDDLLDVEFQMKSGIDLLKELEEFYLSNPETEASEARKLAVLIKGYLQSMKSNIREIIRYIDDTTLEKSNEEKKNSSVSAPLLKIALQYSVITSSCSGDNVSSNFWYFLSISLTDSLS